MLLRGETNFTFCTLKYYSVLIFNFSDIKHSYKIKIQRITSQVLIKNLRNQRTLRYQKNCLQLSYDSTETSDVKTRRKNNSCKIYFIEILSFVQFRPYATTFLGFFSL